MSPSVTALVGFAAWQVLLTMALGVYRTSLVLGGKRAANAFATDGSDVAPFGGRLTRARDNCYENLPMFTALVAGAALAGRGAVTDGLAMWFLGARIGQSVTHLASTSVPAVQLRFAFYLTQIAIMACWAFRLLAY